VQNKVERLLLNALAMIAALPRNIRSFGGYVRIVFGEADPPAVDTTAATTLR
jgi:hypothetical protein